MSITVVSSVSSSAAPLPLGAALGEESVPLDFANLLGEQLSNSLGALLASAEENAPVAKEEKKIEAAAEDMLNPLQLAELPVLTPSIANQPVDSLPDSQLPEHVEALLAEVSNGKAVSNDFMPGTKLPLNQEIQDDIPSTEGFSAPPITDTEAFTKGTAKFSDALTASRSADTESLPASPRVEILPTATSTNNPTDLAAKLSEALSRPRPMVVDNPIALQTSTEGKTAFSVLTGETANIAAETPVSSNETTTPVAISLSTSPHPSQNLSEAQTTSHIPVNIHDNQWAQSFGEKIVWLAKNDQQTAQISINPPQLGPMQISLSMNGDQANALFASPHVEVRQAIEDAMPRLREMLSAAGISLGDANVSTQLPQQNRDNPSQFANPSGNGGRSGNENAILAEDGKIPSISSPLPIQRGRGLVDLFA